MATTNETVAFFHDYPVSNNKRDREELSLLTTSPALSLSTVDPIISDESDDSSSSDEENIHPQDRSLARWNNKKRRRNQQVAFGDIGSTTTYHPSNITKAELKEMKASLWFTKQDRLRSQAECQQVLKEFRITNAEEVTQFSEIYRTSMQVPFSQASSDFLEKATISVPLVIRGMEWGLTPKLRKRRKEHIRSILNAQKEIRDIELRERFVSSRSLRSSRPARIMARIIGEGDVVAKGTTSTALNIQTLKAPSAVTPRTGTVSTSATKIGHARRRRRPLLWRNDRCKAVSIKS